MAVSLAAQLEVATIERWFHLDSPLDNWSVYEVLTDGLIQAKRDYRAALAAHDHERAGVHLAEVSDLTALCAAAADGLALQRVRFMTGGCEWPLARYHA